jgi:hypothetical protein
MGQRSGNVFRGEKNRRSDDPADEEQNGIEQSESSNQSRLSGNGLRGGCRAFGCEWRGSGVHQPIPSSSGDSNGVPQRRQMIEEQSPQVSGSVTSLAQFGQ